MYFWIRSSVSAFREAHIDPFIVYNPLMVFLLLHLEARSTLSKSFENGTLSYLSHTILYVVTLEPGRRSSA